MPVTIVRRTKHQVQLASSRPLTVTFLPESRQEMKLSSPPTWAQLEQEFPAPRNENDETDNGRASTSKSEYDGTNEDDDDNDNDSLLAALRTSDLFGVEENSIENSRESDECFSPLKCRDEEEMYDGTYANNSCQTSSRETEMWLLDQIRLWQTRNQAQKVEIDVLQKTLRKLQESIEYTCRAGSPEELQLRLAALKEKAVASAFCWTPTSEAKTSETADAEKAGQLNTTEIQELQEKNKLLETIINGHFELLRRLESQPECARRAASSSDVARGRSTLENLSPDERIYDVRIQSPIRLTLFTPQELKDSLFAKADNETINDLKERPVVAFLPQWSDARAAGVKLGHVLLRVNGVEVACPRTAELLLSAAPFPQSLQFYVPRTEIVAAQGNYMVQYNCSSAKAPIFGCMWKRKYVAVGGICSLPWIIRMYNSRSEYETAISQALRNENVTVKVKQFALRGARIGAETQTVHYSNEPTSRVYIVVFPYGGKPIKISALSTSELRPVEEAIRRALNVRAPRVR